MILRRMEQSNVDIQVIIKNSVLGLPAKVSVQMMLIGFFIDCNLFLLTLFPIQSFILPTIIPSQVLYFTKTCSLGGIIAFKFMLW